MFLTRIYVLLTLYACHGIFILSENDPGPTGNEPEPTAEEARRFLEYVVTEISNQTTDYMENYWNYYTNLTDENQMISVESASVYAAVLQNITMEAKPYLAVNYSDESLNKALKACCGQASDGTYGKQKYKQKATLRADNLKLYSTATVCNKPGDANDTCYKLNPGLDNIFKDSRDWDELQWVWKNWRDQTGKKMKSQYEKFVQLENEYGQSKGYADRGEEFKSTYKVDNFEELCADLWSRLRPLYIELHTYTRRKLMNIYGEERFPKTGHIPAHITGNMWAQRWNNIYEDVLPYPDAEIVDVTAAMIQQNYTIERVFRTAEEFFTSLGFEELPQEFWDRSILEQPTDGRNIVCHASAWDFFNGSDFRIKQCTEINQLWLGVTHHEMGHVQYYMSYKHQPYYYRDGANAGFHEGLGDLILLSVMNPRHLQEIGLLERSEISPETDMNALMQMALEDVSFLPFGYLIDLWRWSVFSGDTPPEHYTRDWWRLRCDLQGISPAVPRNEEDFDPGAKYHVPSNTPYIRYFIANILTYQMQKSLCEAAGHEGPLHQCDIYRSEAAGQKLRSTLALGSSVHWSDALESLTGSREIRVEPLLEYYQPLIEWLQEQNEGEDKGWDSECPEGMLSLADKIYPHPLLLWTIAACILSIVYVI